MSDSADLLLVLLLWPVIGLTLALVLGRRGHDPFGWLVVGTLLGPLALPLVVYAVREDEPTSPAVVASPRSHPAGSVDVIVGIDGSAESVAALEGVEMLLNGRTDRLTLVAVVPFDGGHDDERRSRHHLEQAARHATTDGVGLEVARGRPVQALQSIASDGGYDLIAIGTAGTGRAHLLGSVAKDLADGSAIPVLLVPPPHQEE